MALMEEVRIKGGEGLGGKREGRGGGGGRGWVALNT